MMLPTVCFFIGMAMMACTIVGYACIRVGAMSEYEEMLSRERGKTAGEGYRTECVSAIICFPQVETYKSRR